LSKYLATEKKLSARKNQPLVIFGSQLARNASDSVPRSAHRLDRVGMIDGHIALTAARSIVAGELRDALEQSRFTGAILADDDGDGVVETE
jgi:hypothetical protein